MALSGESGNQTGSIQRVWPWPGGRMALPAGGSTWAEPPPEIMHVGVGADYGNPAKSRGIEWELGVLILEQDHALFGDFLCNLEAAEHIHDAFLGGIVDDAGSKHRAQDAEHVR